MARETNGASERSLTCISCPLGCQLTVFVADGVVTGVMGNGCPRGDAYGRAEVTNPVRSVTTTVPVYGSVARRVSVKTAMPIPKARVEAVIDALAGASATAPVAIGDVIVADVAKTGVDVVATCNVDA